MGVKICLKRDVSTRQSTPTPTIRHGTEHKCIGTWSQISNIFIAHKKDTRIGLFLSNQSLIVFFDYVLYHLIVSLPMTLKFWEAVVQRCSVKKVFLEISQNSQGNTCATASVLIKLQPSAYRKSGTHDPRVGPWTWDPKVRP